MIKNQFNLKLRLLFNKAIEGEIGMLYETDLDNKLFG